MKKHIIYSEGQWFAVPLKGGGYALGVIVRGSHSTKGGLGYFFGPKLISTPDESFTAEKNPSDAILISWFGDLGIVEGTWPLISSSRPFSREQWPVPRFGQIDVTNPHYGWLVEYGEEVDGFEVPIRRTYCSASQLADFPKDGIAGAGAIELRLGKLLE